MWDVRFVFWCCGVLYCCGLWCVVCGVCGVCVWCVWCVWRGLGTRKNSVCRFKTSPCVGSKRFRVCRQNARMCSTCARFAGTHGSVLNRHTERREGRGGVLFSLSRPLSLSLFRRSLPSFSFFVLFLSSLSLFSSHSVTMTMITRPVGSLCTHSSDSP